MDLNGTPICQKLLSQLYSPIVDIAKSLQILDYDKDRLKTMFVSMSHSLPKEVERLNEAFAKGDREGLYLHASDIKKLASQLAVDQIGVSAQALENAVFDSRLTIMVCETQKLNCLCTLFLKETKNYLKLFS